MRVKCLAYEHNAMSPARSRTRTARSGVERTNHEATAPHTQHIQRYDAQREELQVGYADRYDDQLHWQPWTN